MSDAILNLQVPPKGSRVMVTRDGETFAAEVTAITADADTMWLSFVPVDQTRNGLYGRVALRQPEQEQTGFQLFVAA